MLGKSFDIGESLTKSCLSFSIRESEPPMKGEQSLFRDPAALPMLHNVVQRLHAQGYEVTAPKTGKACHGACRISFPDVEITVILMVERRAGKIEFDILTWPSQTLRQRISRRKMKSADCK